MLSQVQPLAAHPASSSSPTPSAYLLHGLRILSAIELDLNIEKVAKIQIVNLYNPPKNFEGLDELHSWLNLSTPKEFPLSFSWTPTCTTNCGILHNIPTLTDSPSF
jgi:hypothetical protein